MNSELIQFISFSSGIIGLIILVMFFRLSANVSKIKSRLLMQNYQDLKFKAEIADFKNDTQKVSYFLDYIYYLHYKSDFFKSVRRKEIKVYYDKIKEIGGEDLVPQVIKTEYEF
jgi:hypothetical protein